MLVTAVMMEMGGEVPGGPYPDLDRGWHCLLIWSFVDRWITFPQLRYGRYHLRVGRTGMPARMPPRAAMVSSFVRSVAGFSPFREFSDTYLDEEETSEGQTSPV